MSKSLLRELAQRVTLPRAAGPLRAYFGHHKCGTQWIKEMMQDASRRLRIHELTIQEEVPADGLRQRLAAERIQFLSLTNANPHTVAQIGPLRAFHVVRDPRDVIVSAYFSHRNSHPRGEWLEKHRARLRELDAEAGLLEELRFSEYTLDQLRRWDYAQRDVLELRLEEFAAAPVPTLARIADFLDLPLFGFELRRIAQRHSFAKKTGGRPIGIEDPKHHYRKGQPGDWANHFKPSHKAYFKEHYQDVLEKLGYETSRDW